MFQMNRIYSLFDLKIKWASQKKNQFQIEPSFANYLQKFTIKGRNLEKGNSTKA